MPEPQPAVVPSIGFWRCWSLTVGCMIGSGIFLMPAVLVPYGTVSIAGWAVTGAGTILIAMTMGHLAARIPRIGGPYAYVHAAFGDLPGFLAAWGYWLSNIFAVPAIAFAFAGYLGVLIPAVEARPAYHAGAAIGVIWLFTLINIAGVSAAGTTQLVTTLLKLIPLVVIIGLAAFSGDAGNLPEFNPSGGPLLPALQATVLLTMWAYSAFEASTVPAADVIEPRKTIPRALVAGTVTVAVIYMLSSVAVMSLVPSDVLAGSSSPFADAALRLGRWGPWLIAVGALISTAGALNGIVLLTGQVPLAVALDGLVPRWFGRRDPQGAPFDALLLSAALGTGLVLFNYAAGLVAAFTLLATISLVVYMAALTAAVAADLRFAWRRSRTWLSIGAIAFVYSLFALVGAGVEMIVYGAVLLALGVPVFYLGRQSLRRGMAAGKT
jgi:basic amino acid/polyamine antiporter, APA family